jgi:hypothetical protein
VTMRRSLVTLRLLPETALLGHGRTFAPGR